MLTSTIPNCHNLKSPVVKQNQVRSTDESQIYIYDAATTSESTKNESIDILSTYSRQQNPIIEKLYRERNQLILRRNELLNLPFLWARPRKKTELKNIDHQLDSIEMNIYNLQHANNQTYIQSLRSFISDIQQRIEKCISE